MSPCGTKTSSQVKSKRQLIFENKTSDVVLHLSLNVGYYYSERVRDQEFLFIAMTFMGGRDAVFEEGSYCQMLTGRQKVVANWGCSCFQRRYLSSMKTLRDHQSADLFDPWEYLGPQRRKLLEKSWAGLFRDFLLCHLPVKEFASAFSDGMGRPSKDLFMALGSLILQQLHDLTDKETVESLALNIAWHYALDIRHESDAYLCERTLRNYRIKVIEAGLEQVIFCSLTDAMIEQFRVNTTKQRIDSTAIRSAIRGLTRLGILVEATSKFLRELKRQEPDLFATVDVELVRKYLDRGGDGCFANTRPSESKRRLSL